VAKKRADTVHLVRGMVGIRVYVHNAMPLYPDYTPFTADIEQVKNEKKSFTFR
jgi:hypothetical protein